MPIGWKPKSSRIQQLITEEEARIELLRQKRGEQVSETAPIWSPSMAEAPTPSRFESIFPQAIAPVRRIPSAPTAVMEAPIPRAPITPAKVTPEEPKEPVSFWQRALQVFTAPFEWVDENILKPGLAVTATTMGFLPDVERKPGEDFWEWKKRSWAGWEPSGMEINVPWRDEPWRVDWKGVLEFAPWLLIPGAGQVGGGVRAATGIAGILGRAGRVGRVLGTAVEYSPWGLVEKTAGAAIKGGIRATGKVSERVSTAVGEKLFGKYVPPPVPAAVAKFTQYAKEVVIPSRKAFRKEMPELRARQEARVREVQAKYQRGEISVDEFREAERLATAGALKPEFALTPEALAARQASDIANVEARVVSGEISEAVGKGLITKIRKSPAFTAVPFEAGEINELRDMIVNGVESGLIKRNSGQAFDRMLLDGVLPEPRNLKDWAKVFGVDFAKAVGKLSDNPEAAKGWFESLNAFRTLQTSMDLSATFRQGLFFGLLHPTRIPNWFGRQLKYLVSEKLALDLDDALRARPITKIFLSGKTPGYLRPLRETTLNIAEEAYMPGGVIRHVPGIRRSERAFAGYINESAVDTFELGYNAMKAQGATDEMIDVWRGFINMAGGRGTLPKSLEQYAPALNLVLFSPRLQAATLQMPRQIGRMLISKNPYMRKEAAKALIAFVGGGSALVGLLSATGRGKVEDDPRAGDFGKIVIGETRLDIWRGYIQYARFVAQLLSGERKSAYGNMNKAERGEIAGRFIQSKMSPVAGMMADLWRNETYQGEPLFSDTTGFSKAAKNRLLPLAVQDTIDAVEQSGANGMWVAAPATLGIGALTYVNDFVRVKEKIAREMGYSSWDDIDPKTQREIENRNAELQTATIAFDRQMMGTAWGDWKLAGNAVEDVFRNNVDNAVNKFRASVAPNKGHQFKKDISDAWTARRGGYDVREKEERFEDIVNRMKTQSPAEALVTLGPEGTAIKTYTDALFGDDMYDEFGDYRFDEANVRKGQLHQQLGEEMFNYVEEYQGMRFEDLPPEFQDLARAKIVMKPYWQVRDRVIKLFGQRFADSSRGQALVSKLRRQKRLADPEMERAYRKYYVQS
tara:strand:+ start:8073 stop:11333 length:3261 start_codon:yes stop_codon:yes gene_type:complete